MSGATRCYDQIGRVRVIVPIVLVLLVAGTAIVLSRFWGGGGRAPVVNQPGESAVATDTVVEDRTPPVISTLTQLEQLVEDASAEALALEELGPEATASQMRNAEREWHAWATGFGERLEQVVGGMPESPGDEAEQELQLGYDRMTRAVEQLRRLAPNGSTVEVPRLVVRQSIFGIARNHLQSARTYFHRIGL